MVTTASSYSGGETENREGETWLVISAGVAMVTAVDACDTLDGGGCTGGGCDSFGRCFIIKATSAADASGDRGEIWGGDEEADWAASLSLKSGVASCLLSTQGLLLLMPLL